MEERQKEEIARKEFRQSKVKELQDTYTKNALIKLFSQKNQELREIILILKEAIESYPKGGES